jgi:hypothetical protein
MKRSLVAGLAALGVLSACGDDGDEPEPGYETVLVTQTPPTTAATSTSALPTAASTAPQLLSFDAVCAGIATRLSGLGNSGPFGPEWDALVGEARQLLNAAEPAVAAIFTRSSIGSTPRDRWARAPTPGSRKSRMRVAHCGLSTRPAAIAEHVGPGI